jgi:hypothetical protein
MFHVKHFCVRESLAYAILQNNPMDQKIGLGKQDVDTDQFRHVFGANIGVGQGSPVV